MTKRLVIVVSILAVIGIGIGLALHFKGKSAEPAGTAISGREPSAELLKQRGPLPTESRLQDGARQVEDPAQALEMARDSLTRVEEEIAEAKDDAERVKLLRKKELIEKAIGSLTVKP